MSLITQTTKIQPNTLMNKLQEEGLGDNQEMVVVNNKDIAKI